MNVGTLKVPGATLRYEVRGSGPVLLLIPGGAGDAGLYEGMADLLAAAGHTVVSYDQRGLSRRPLDGPLADQLVAEWREDALSVLDAVVPAGEQAYVFGSSSGAIVALDLLAAHPERVRRLVAHEPPLVELLADPDPYRAHFAEVRELNRTQGLGPAMARFAEQPGEGPGETPGEATSAPAAGTAATDAAATDAVATDELATGAVATGAVATGTVAAGERGQQRPHAELPPSIRPMAARMTANLPVFLEHVLCPFSSSRPDVGRLHAAAAKLILGVGRESAGQEALVGPARRLAELTGAPTAEFPGGHVGCTEYPGEFAALLLTAMRR
ncbi:alpha/beta fold hydrolase [Streptomyces sp. NPDC085481]|uniref:alpha/beta fold hydrolase n=1 Tax=Streptomyces sp. NPDC085481 TaxID=3365727 RepID=UPI0037D6D9A5